MQVGALDPEHDGRARDVPSRELQRVDDVLPLLLLAELSQRRILAGDRRGARRRIDGLLRCVLVGLVGGVVTYALPLTVLRPCCSAEAMATGTSCCTMPSACLGAGALLGFALAAFVPLGPSRWRTALGMSLGVGSVAILRCSTLLGAEALGLMGGLLGGVVAATGARLVVARKPAR